MKCEARKLKLWQFWDDHSDNEEEEIKAKSTYDSIYTITQTSDSTGRPKLVLIPNRVFINDMIPRKVNPSPLPPQSILV